eukprot:1666099-Amphidinium_carterae.1
MHVRVSTHVYNMRVSPLTIRCVAVACLQMRPPIVPALGPIPCVPCQQACQSSGILCAPPPKGANMSTHSGLPHYCVPSNARTLRMRS